LSQLIDITTYFLMSSKSRHWLRGFGQAMPAFVWARLELSDISWPPIDSLLTH
jgi:hypothetical protein